MKLYEHDDLKAVVELWIKGYEQRDKALIKEVMSASPEVFYYGAGVDEHISGLDGMLEQLDRDWRQSQKAEVTMTGFRWQKIFEDCAWVACELQPKIEVEGKALSLPEIRCTIVLVRENKKWKMVHSHASWPYSEQAEGESFPAA